MQGFIFISFFAFFFLSGTFLKFLHSLNASGFLLFSFFQSSKTNFNWS